MPASCYDEGEAEGRGEGQVSVPVTGSSWIISQTLRRSRESPGFTAPATPDRARGRCVGTPSDAPGSICG